MQVWPGHWYPLGATWDGAGTNFSVFSQHAERFELCLFDDAGRETRITLPEITAGCWHAYLPGIGAGQRYAYRVHGPFAPEEGHRFNPNKLLLDPYAKSIEGEIEYNPAVYGYRFDDPAADLSRNDDDSAPFVPRSIVVDTRFEWEFAIPDGRFGRRWELLLDTDDPDAEEGARAWGGDERVRVEGRSIVVLRRGH